MVKLDATMLRYLTAEDFRVLTAIEMGMKNHELVPGNLVQSISGQRSGTAKRLNELTRNRLVVFERGKRFDGYRLSYLGYDYLALRVFVSRGTISHVGNQIGVGKESDVYVVANEDSRHVLKLHRLGRTSFRNVHDKRDYEKAGHKVHNWIYLSRLAAIREYKFMKILHEKGYPVPKPIDQNRHCVLMELIPGTLLNQVTVATNVDKLYNRLMDVMLSLANELGVVHGDYNEFNIILKDEGSEDEPVLIDLPQMVPVDHLIAEEYFDRDVRCINDFFQKRFNYSCDYVPTFKNDVQIKNSSEIQDLLKDSDDKELLEDEEEEDANVEDEDDKLSSYLKGLKVVQDEHENTESEHKSPDGFDARSMMSSSTFAPKDIKRRIKKEADKDKKRRERRVLNKPKNIKGDHLESRRTKRDTNDIIKTDSNIDY